MKPFFNYIFMAKSIFVTKTIFMGCTVSLFTKGKVVFVNGICHPCGTQWFTNQTAGMFLGYNTLCAVLVEDLLSCFCASKQNEGKVHSVKHDPNEKQPDFPLDAPLPHAVFHYHRQDARRLGHKNTQITLDIKRLTSRQPSPI